MNSQDDGEDAHAYCYDCDWYALPGDHEFKNVMTATEAHTTFERGHTATVGASEEVVTEARKRAE